MHVRLSHVTQHGTISQTFYTDCLWRSLFVETYLSLTATKVYFIILQYTSLNQETIISHWSYVENCNRHNFTDQCACRKTNVENDCGTASQSCRRSWVMASYWMNKDFQSHWANQRSVAIKSCPRGPPLRAFQQLTRICFFLSLLYATYVSIGLPLYFI